MNFIILANSILLIALLIYSAVIFLRIRNDVEKKRFDARAHKLCMDRVIIDDMKPSMEKIASLERWQRDLEQYAEDHEASDSKGRESHAGVRLVVDNKRA
ncbi:TPA: hypothetical protein QDZ84_002527 [Shewanella algae]|uniref:hypothetical protein n=1 Tax=Shewanella TaxID=22 RepID=UPI0005ECCD8D|nr:hypothetical protein [Shewanella algae]EKT4486719.1 hypothetical protein [Shewanella algae]HDS1207512.1 hypothetical protein [Shewanella algae]